MRPFLLAPAVLVVLTPLSPAAPGLPDKPAKWEYAELSYRNVPGRPKTTDAEGNEVPATSPSMTIRWTTAASETTAKSWEELADKLKATGFKKDAPATHQRIQVLNALGAEGWELMEATVSSPAAAAGFGGDRGPGGAGRGFGTAATTGTWLLKRRVP